MKQIKTINNHYLTILGERLKTKDNKILGSFKIMNIPPGPPGAEKFEVEFDLDADGILTVSATHKNSGRRESLTGFAD